MIRKAEFKDLPDIAKILCQSHSEHMQFSGNYFLQADINALLENLTAEFKKCDNCEYFVYELNGTVIAFAQCKIKLSEKDVLKKYCRKCIIVNFAVSEEYRRKHIGKMLSEHIKQFAKSNLCDCIEIDVWYENYNAVDFCASVGFIPQMYKMAMKI